MTHIRRGFDIQGQPVAPPITGAELPFDRIINQEAFRDKQARAQNAKLAASKTFQIRSGRRLEAGVTPAIPLSGAQAQQSRARFAAFEEQQAEKRVTQRAANIETGGSLSALKEKRRQESIQDQLIQVQVTEAQAKLVEAMRTGTLTEGMIAKTVSELVAAGVDPGTALKVVGALRAGQGGATAAPSAPAAPTGEEPVATGAPSQQIPLPTGGARVTLPEGDFVDLDRREQQIERSMSQGVAAIKESLSKGRGFFDSFSKTGKRHRLSVVNRTKEVLRQLSLIQDPEHRRILARGYAASLPTFLLDSRLSRLVQRVLASVVASENGDPDPNLLRELDRELEIQRKATFSP